MTRGSGWPSARPLRMLSVMRIVGGSVGRAAPSASKLRSAVPSFFLPATVGRPRMLGIMVGMESTTLEGFVPRFLFAALQWSRQVLSGPPAFPPLRGAAGLSFVSQRMRMKLATSIQVYTPHTGCSV